MKKYIKMNDNDNYLSLGNFCRVFKNISYNKVFTNQTNICMILFSDDTLSDTLINNYCVGYRSINMKYKNKYLEYKDKYKKDKLSLINLINELINLLHGSIDNLYSYEDINQDELLIKLCKKLYNIAKNDKNINGEFTIKLNNYIKNNKYYECIIQILFYIILDNKQPINEDDIIKDTIENILNKTNISINDLEKFLMLNFKDGVNYIYELKRLVKENNAYACFEMGYMEYKGEITGIPRYNKAYEYLLISSLNNHPRACLLIGEMLLTNKIGNGSEEDKLVALKYLTKASELGSVAALNKLGLYYLNIDKSKAIEYFNKAIKEDYVYSYNNLGKIYEDMKDYKKAFDYYMKSALKEESWACNKLGEFYRKGIYVEKNMKLAFDYYNLSTNVPVYLLEYYSKYNLAKYFYQCGNYELGIEKDIEKAITLYDESSNHDVIESSIELLNIYIDKYLENKNKDNLLKVNYYKDKILNSRKYNNEICAKIEKILSKIEVNNEKIFIIEDDDAIGIGLKYYLEQENFIVKLTTTGSEALDKIKLDKNIDLILLDVNLPDYNGFDLFKEIKKINNYPIIFLTANDLETSIVMGIDMGADDYITKPFKARELLARINATLRRYGNNNSNIIKIQDIIIDLKQAKVFKNNKDMMFTALEYKIFLTFALNQNTVITREKILADIWDINSDYVNDNTLTVYIKRIREKIEDDPTNPKILKTVRGIGYVVGE